MNIIISSDEIHANEISFKHICEKYDDCDDCPYYDINSDCGRKYFYESGYKNGYRAAIKNIIRETLEDI